MKLKEFERKITVTPLSHVKAAISFHKKGKIVLTKALADKLNIKDNTTISLYQDEDKPEDWYVCFGTISGATIRVKPPCEKYKSGQFHASNSNASRSILDYFHVKKSSCCAIVEVDDPVTHDEVVYYKLFTKPLKIEKDKVENANKKTFEFSNGRK